MEISLYSSQVCDKSDNLVIIAQVLCLVVEFEIHPNCQVFGGKSGI